MSLLITLVYILFVVSAIVLVVVILLQEGKGGGLADVLGTAGQQTFGVGSSGIQKFTAATATIFMPAPPLLSGTASELTPSSTSPCQVCSFHGAGFSPLPYAFSGSLATSPRRLSMPALSAR